MAKKNYGGVYANMEFPPYEYIPYPRHIITGPNGLYEVANSEEEEKRIKDRLRKAHDDAPAEFEAFIADPEKDILVSRARELNVPINRKWSKQKLQQVIQEAESAIDSLPPEDQEDAKSVFAETPVIDHFAHIQTSLSAPAQIEEDDKDELVAQAKALGLPATKVWGIPRLKASIAEAQGN